MSWLDRAAVELAEAVRSGEVRAVDLLDVHIARHATVNPNLNAVVDVRFGEARREAADLDARRDAGDDLSALPLAGVPVTIKEFHDVEGLHCTGGLYRRRDRVAPSNAPVVQRLKEAGAIVMGVTNAPEGGLWMETYNRTYGWTNNPWSTARTPGGSSGGEGAAVASGLSALGLGSDIGGSIRIPAAMCGTVGHKPTGGMVPNTGQFGHHADNPLRYLCSGPLTRRVADVMPALRVLAGPDAGDPGVTEWHLGDPDAVEVGALVVYRVPHSALAPVSPAIRQALERAEAALVGAGAEVRDLDEPDLAQGFVMWGAKLSASFEGTYAEVLGDGAPVAYGRELLRKLGRRSDFTFPGLTLSMLSDIANQLPGTQDSWVARADRLRDALDDRLGDRGVLLGPSFPFTAPVHRGLWRNPFSHSYVCVYNVLELPATVVPTGLDRKGLPTSVQLAGARGMDHVPLAAAAVVEAATGGWQRADVRIERRRDVLRRRLARSP